MSLLHQQPDQDSAERLRVALNAAQMGMWDWDIVTGSITWSLEHEQLFGLPLGSFDGRYETFDERLHPDDREGLHQAIAHSLQNQIPYHHEYRIIWADGSIHWVEGRGRAFYNEVGQPVRMSGTIMAIDERKQAQILLQQQLEQQRLIMEITQRIRQSLNLPEILQTTVDEVRQFLQVDRVIILQFTPDWEGIVAVESVGNEAFSILPCNIDDPCIGRSYVETFQQGLVTAKANIYMDDISPCHVEFLAQFHVRANLVVPILKNNNLWGLLAAHHCTAPREWQSSEVDLLRQIAAQVSIAIQQSALLEQVQTELMERQQAEAALNQQESLLQLFAQYAPAGIAMFDQDMRYVMASQRWVDEYQLGSVASVIGRSHYDIFPEIPERWRQVHQRCLAGAVEHGENELFVRADGTRQWISWEVHPWYTAAGEIGGIIIFSRDITEWNHIEASLRQSEVRLRLAQVASNSGVWDWDVPTSTLYWSPEYYQLYGLDPAIEATYENWLSCIHPDDREQVNQITLSALADAQVELRAEFRVLRADGVRWFSGIGQVLRNEVGEATRVIGITIDITQQKQAEITLQQLNTELEQRVAERTAELTALSDRLLVAYKEQAQTQEALRESEERRRLALDLTRIGFWDWHLPSQKVVWNDNHYALLGVTPEACEPSYELWQRCIHPGDVGWVEQRFADSLKYQTDYTAEYRVIHPDGSIHWLMARAKAVYDNTGEPMRSLGVLLEITDRKQAEVALQQQTQQNQLLWTITQAIRQSLTPDVFLNAAVTAARQLLRIDRVAIYRFNPNWGGDFVMESVAEGWVKLVDPNVCKVWEDTYLQETQGGRFHNHENCIVADIYTATLQPCHIELLEQFQARAYAIAPIFVGEFLWGLFALYHNAAPHHWEPWETELLQQIAGQLAISIQKAELYNQLQTELQEHQQTEAILREAERRWRSLLDNVQLIVVGLDQLGCVNYVNPFFLHLTGYRDSEVLGKNWFENFTPACHQQAVQVAFFEELADNAYPYYQNSILTKAGEERFIAWNNTSLQDFDGRVIGTISIGEDITERQKVEQMKNEFIGIVSHELRTPLTAIQMSLGLLKMGIYANKPEKSQRMIEIALTDTNRLVNLVNDILDLERLESERTVLEKTVCQAMDLMQQAVEGMQAIATQHHITLTLTPTDTTVWATPDMIVQTLTNLLSNAIKFSPAHSVITLRADRQDDNVLFQVTDQGRGIPEDKLETIFGRFQQVDASDSREKGGTGLGLSICRSIMEQHKGKIWAESTLGEGSTFLFTLPLPPGSTI